MRHTLLAQTALIVGALTFMVTAPVTAAGGAKTEGMGAGGAQGEAQAAQHTRQAIEQGKLGKAENLRKHAETALKIAEKAEKQQPEAHLGEGIKHLKMAVEEAKKGNAEEGTKHAEEALTHLEQ